MPFWKCYYHVVWATYQRTPLITPALEKVILEAVERKSNALECSVLAANTLPDHIHVAVNIPPKVAVADWVRNVKGLAAHEVNIMNPHLPQAFRWQGGYGVLTFGAKNLPLVMNYVQRQKEHHASETLQDYLEQLE